MSVMRVNIYLIAIVLSVAVMLVTCEPEPAGASESVNLYIEYEHLTILDDSLSSLLINSVVCTLGVFSVDALKSDNNIVDSTREEYLTGVNTFVMSVKMVCYGAGDSVQVDSLWWHFYSESGLGPLVEGNNGSVVIGPNITDDGVYGPFEAITDTTEGRIYPLMITRGRGIFYLMGFQETVEDTGVAYSERWGGRR